MAISHLVEKGEYKISGEQGIIGFEQEMWLNLNNLAPIKRKGNKG